MWSKDRILREGSFELTPTKHEKFHKGAQF